MKKIFVFLVGLLPVFVSIPVYADAITVKTDAPILITLKSGNRVLDEKEINGAGEFDLPEGDVGRYMYEITDGKTSYTIEQYIVYRGDVKESSFISYVNNEKQDEIFFYTDDVPTVSAPPETSGSTETAPPSETPPPPVTTGSSENIHSSESEETGTTVPGTTIPGTNPDETGESSVPSGKTENVNTGDANKLPLYIGVAAAAGAGIGVTVFFVRKKKKGDE